MSNDSKATEKCADSDSTDRIMMCRSTFQTLIECSKKNFTTPDSGTTYIREFFETTPCDHIKDFSLLRREFQDKINTDDPNRLKRIQNFKETPLDEKVANQASLHNRVWHKSNFEIAIKKTYSRWL